MNRIELRLDVEIVDMENGKPSVLHLSHPKLDGVLEFYLDSYDSMESQLEAISISTPEYIPPPETRSTSTQTPTGKTVYKEGSVVSQASKFIDGVNFLRQRLKK